MIVFIAASVSFYCSISTIKLVFLLKTKHIVQCLVGLILKSTSHFVILKIIKPLQLSNRVHYSI